MNEQALLNLLKDRLDCETLATVEQVRGRTKKKKYLNTEKWFQKIWTDVRDSGLHNSSPKRILDIGTGPGYFPLICNYLGHECFGLDKPATLPWLQRLWSPLPDGVYKTLRAASGTEAFEHLILPFTPLPAFEAKFDVATAFRTSFNAVRRNKRLFNLVEWKFFLDDLRDNVLKPGGIFLLRMNEKYPYEGLVWNSPPLMNLFIDRGATMRPVRFVSFNPLK